MLIYESGPMTGYPEHNYPEFFRVAKLLRDRGLEVINPAELHPADPSVPWDWYLRRDIAELVKCSHLVLLRGWEFSRGARLEHTIAKELGMTVVQWNELEGWLSERA